MANYIPENFYVGRRSDGENTVLGFMSPITGDTSCSKRKKSVDSWSDSKLPKLTIPNKSEVGYRVVDNCSRYSTSNVVWRVIHPRGFQIEISSHNLMHLIQECNITEGEFMSELIWVRCGSENFLTHKNTDIATTAITSKQLVTKIPLKDVQLGDTVKLKNGTVGVFLGIAHFMDVDYSERMEGKSIKKYIIRTGDKDHRNRTIYATSNTLHIVEIVQKTTTPLSKDDAFKNVESAWGNKNDNNFFTRGTLGVFQKAITYVDAELKLRTITKAEFYKTQLLSEYTIFGVNGKLHWDYSNDLYTGYDIDAREISINKDGKSISVEKSQNGCYYVYSITIIRPANITDYYVLEIVRK